MTVFSRFLLPCQIFSLIFSYEPTFSLDSSADENFVFSSVSDHLALRFRHRDDYMLLEKRLQVPQPPRATPPWHLAAPAATPPPTSPGPAGIAPCEKFKEINTTAERVVSGDSTPLSAGEAEKQEAAFTCRRRSCSSCHFSCRLRSCSWSHDQLGEEELRDGTWS